jgi:uncharacterized membrane protein YphA (DoxX/SURF4 family)
MASDRAESAMINKTARALLRVIIGSYFLAVALALIPGTDLAILFSGVLPHPYDGALAMGLVFALAFMVMLGHATRVAALVMAMITFYASYLTMLQLGVADELGSFWRDLALIAGLLLTYSDDADGHNLRNTAEWALARRKMRPAPAVNFATLSVVGEPVADPRTSVPESIRNMDPTDPDVRLRAIFRENADQSPGGSTQRPVLSKGQRFRIWGA